MIETSPKVETVLEEEDAQSVLSFTSDSDSGSDSSSDNSDIMGEKGELLLKTSDHEDGEIAENDAGSDKEEEIFEDGENEEGGPLKTKNELEKLPPIMPFNMNSLPKDAQFEKVGIVSSCVGEQIIVQALNSGEEIVLETDTVLFILIQKVTEELKMLKDKFNSDLQDAPKDDLEMTSLGRIWDIFGPVKNPFYSIRYNNEIEAKKEFEKISKEKSVFYVPGLSKVVMTKPLKELKGTDASNLYDEEVSGHELEFSDDEKEQEFKKSLKRKKMPCQTLNKKFNSQSDKANLKNEEKIFSNRNASQGYIQKDSFSKLPSSTPIQLPYPEFNERQSSRFNRATEQFNPYLPAAESISAPIPDSSIPISDSSIPISDSSIPISDSSIPISIIHEAQQKQMHQLDFLLKNPPFK